ncbi:MAG: GTP-binding protein [Bacteroidales bacterium]|nr:GTP-binding protein [Bacteroidales bacterium]
MSKTPVYLITGFLGSGKTTFIRQSIGHFSGKNKTGIIQNEFAPASIDGKELKRITGKDFDILEINNGSVFCVCLLSGFITSLKKFVMKYQPDILLIEASGLSDVMSVGEVFNSPELQEHIFLAGTICIVDAGHFMKIENLMPRVRHQVMIADHLLINKTDLNPGHRDILAKIEAINPFGKKYLTTYCDVGLDEIFQPMPVPSWKKLSVFTETPGDAGRPEVRSAVFRSGRPLNSEHLDEFVRLVASKSYRFKGMVWLSNEKTYSIQAVFDDVQYTEVERFDRQTELIAVGKDINIKELKSIYGYYSKV